MQTVDSHSDNFIKQKIAKFFLLKIGLLLILFTFLTSLSAQPFVQCTYPSGSTLCQSVSFHPTINITSNTSTSALLTSSWSSQDVYINATLTVNSTFTIGYSNLKFGPNGKIVVSNAYLFCTTNNFFSCSATGWKGIRVDPGTGTLDFFYNNMEDAQIGIDIASNTAIRILWNYFNRNNIDINVFNCTPNALIAGNRFNCTSATYTGSRSLTGIMIRSAVLTVGTPTGSSFTKNTFVDHERQIECYQGSVLNLHYADFFCANDNAVYSEYSTIVLTAANGSALRNTFSNNFQDILTIATNSTIEFSDFYHCTTDNIRCWFNYNQEIINILDNTITIDDVSPMSLISKVGIDLDRSSGGGGFTYRNNILRNWVTIEDYTTKSQRRSAIRVMGYPGTSDRMEIGHNIIPVRAGGSPSALAGSYTSQFINVTIRQSGGYLVRNNFIAPINIDDAMFVNRWGFYLHDWQSPSGYNIIRDNGVLGGTGTAFDYGLCAYHFFDAGPWTICNNQSDNTLRGFHIQEDCEPSDFSFNTMGHHQRSILAPPPMNPETGALVFDFAGELGPQICRYNQWTVANYAPDNGAWCQTLVNPANPLLSLFEYDVASLPTSLPVPIDPPLVTWFTPVACPAPTDPCHEPENPRDSLDGSGREMILDNQSYMPPPNVKSWEEREDVLIQMLSNPELRNSFAEADIFYNAHIETSAGLFAQFESMLDQAMTINSTLQTSLDQNYSQFQTVLAEIDSLDGTLIDSLSLINANSDFFSYRGTLLNQLSTLNEAKELISDNIFIDRNASLQLCSQLLTELPEATLYESNQKFLNGLQIKQAQGIVFSEGDSIILNEISQQCPALAGRTINKAMNLLSIFMPDMPSVVDCDETEERNNSGFYYNGFSISPSPAQDELNIQFEKTFSGSVEIYNLSGVRVFSQQGIQEKSKLLLPLHNIKAGIYFLTTFSSTRELHTARFVILK